MNKRQNFLDPKSCLNKALEDEPLFVLRAKDPVAAMTVRHWALMASCGVHEASKIDSAMHLANAMDKWRKENLPIDDVGAKP